MVTAEDSYDNKYEFQETELGKAPKGAGVYMFGYTTDRGTFLPLYIGESGNLSQRLVSTHEKLNCVHRNLPYSKSLRVVAQVLPTTWDRFTSETGLIDKYKPICNK